MFEFLNMSGDYDSRKVDCYKSGNIFVSTCAIYDSDMPYETAVAHPDYNDNKIIIVENYASKKNATSGHKRWVKTMTTEPLPDTLQDNGSSATKKIAYGDTNPEFKRKRR